MAKRQELAEETKSKIIEIGVKLILENGFDNVSVEDITKECGISKGSFYTYFKTKEDFIQILYNSPFKELENEISQMINKDIFEKLNYYFFHYIKKVEKTGIQIIRQWIKNVVDPNAKNIDNSFSKLKHDTEFLRKILENAVVDNQLMQEIPIDLVTNFIIDEMYGMIVCWCMSDGNLKLSECTKIYCEMLGRIIEPYKKDNVIEEIKETRDVEIIKLNNEIQIPNIGIGTFMLRPDDAEEAVYNALKSGYRMIDTANAYLNEKAVGRGIEKSGINRQEIFISTKLWPTLYENQNAIYKTLERLGVDYIDLLFIHQPSGNYMAGYRQLERAYKKGIIRSIGISNFYGKKLKEILENAEIKPQVIQVEAHPYYPQLELQEQLKKDNIKLMSWYPLGHGDVNLMKEDVFTKLQKKYHKTCAQIILKWHLQMGYIVIPGSRNPEHIKENFNIFDFSLTEEDMRDIASINKNMRYYNPSQEKEESYAYINLNIDGQK